MRSSSSRVSVLVGMLWLRFIFGSAIEYSFSLKCTRFCFWLSSWSFCRTRFISVWINRSFYSCCSLLKKSSGVSFALSPKTASIIVRQLLTNLISDWFWTFEYYPSLNVKMCSATGFEAMKKQWKITGRRVWAPAWLNLQELISQDLLIKADLVFVT